ncbi:hypothetical protein AGMMS4952_16600 [Spirochaetia bacterium]|nr:hypothetical protein AGMMS4952_16600 [Spirochaetia bacterium]
MKRTTRKQGSKKKASSTKEKITGKTMVSVIFVLVFCFTIAVPIILLDKKTTISMLERRMLVVKPQIPDITTIASWPRQIDAYVTDRFAFRSRLMTLTTWVNFFVLHKSHDKKILVGKDKWLFYIDKSLGDEFANFKKSNLFTESQMKNFILHLELAKETCDRYNIKFIFLMVPTTSSVYPEQYPFPRPEGMSRADQILAALPEHLRDNIIFPLDYLVSKKKEHRQPLYYNNGLHWTKLGCYYAYELLHQKLTPNFPNLPELDLKFIPYRDAGEDNYTILWWGIKKFGDFLQLLRVEPVGGWGNHCQYLVCKSIEENEFNTVVGNASKKGKYGIITENKDKSLPTALVMRDSYFVDLEPFTSSMFSFAEYVWTQPEKRNIQYLEQMPQKPDVFIWEIAERGLEAIPMMPPGMFPYD